VETNGQRALSGGRIEIPEPYLNEWLAWGFCQLAAYLRAHAAFDDYCRRRDARGAA
jgi:hypothetical protein